jgi:hypothetical protein
VDVVDVGAAGVADGELAPGPVAFADGAAQRGRWGAVAAPGVPPVMVTSASAGGVPWRFRGNAAVRLVAGVVQVVGSGA